MVYYCYTNITHLILETFVWTIVDPNFEHFFCADSFWGIHQFHAPAPAGKRNHWEMPIWCEKMRQTNDSLHIWGWIKQGKHRGLPFPLQEPRSPRSLLVIVIVTPKRKQTFVQKLSFPLIFHEFEVKTSSHTNSEPEGYQHEVTDQSWWFHLQFESQEVFKQTHFWHRTTQHKQAIFQNSSG